MAVGGSTGEVSAEAVHELTARVAGLERHNLLMRRAMAVLFTLIGIGLLLLQMTLAAQRRSRARAVETVPARTVDGIAANSR